MDRLRNYRKMVQSGAVFGKGSSFRQYEKAQAALDRDYGVTGIKSNTTRREQRRDFRAHKKDYWDAYYNTKSLYENLAKSYPVGWVPEQMAANATGQADDIKDAGNLIQQLQAERTGRLYALAREAYRRKNNPTPQERVNDIAERKDYRGLAGLMTNVAMSPLFFATAGTPLYGNIARGVGRAMPKIGNGVRFALEPFEPVFTKMGADAATARLGSDLMWGAIGAKAANDVFREWGSYTTGQKALNGTLAGLGVIPAFHAAAKIAGKSLPVVANFGKNTVAGMKNHAARLAQPAAVTRNPVSLPGEVGYHIVNPNYGAMTSEQKVATAVAYDAVNGSTRGVQKLPHTGSYAIHNGKGWVLSDSEWATLNNNVHSRNIKPGETLVADGGEYVYLVKGDKNDFHIINAITKEDAARLPYESLQTELGNRNVGVRSDIRGNRFTNSGVEGQPRGYQNNGELGVYMEGRNQGQSYGSEKLTARDKEALQSVRSQLKQAANSGGEVRGFNLNGKVYTFPEGMNAETLLHEGSGVWFDVLRSSNSRGYASAKEVLRRDLPDLIDELKADPNYKGLLADEDAVLKEVFERFSGRRGAARLEEMARQGKEGLVSRIKEFLNKMWGWVSENVFNVKTFRNPEEIADMALKDMLDGAGLGSVKSDGVGFDIIDNAKFIKKANDYFQGYKNIPLWKAISEKATNNAVKARIAEHNTYVRGVRDTEDVTGVVAKALGKNPEDVTADDRMIYMLTHYPPDTSHGRAGLKHLRSDYGGLYTSNSFDTAFGYAALGGSSRRVGNEVDGKVGIVRRPYTLGTDRWKWFEEGDGLKLVNPYEEASHKNVNDYIKQKYGSYEDFVSNFNISGINIKHVNHYNLEFLGATSDEIYAYIDALIYCNSRGIDLSAGNVLSAVKKVYVVKNGKRATELDKQDMANRIEYFLRKILADGEAEREFYNDYLFSNSKYIFTTEPKMTPEDVKSLGFRINSINRTLRKTGKENLGDLYQHYIFTGPIGEKGLDFIRFVDPSEMKGARLTRAHTGMFTEGLSRKQYANGGPLSSYRRLVGNLYGRGGGTRQDGPPRRVDFFAGLLPLSGNYSGSAVTQADRTRVATTRPAYSTYNRPTPLNPIRLNGAVNYGIFNNYGKTSVSDSDSWITDENLMERLAQFQTAFENYISDAKYVDDENGGQSILGGYGLKRYYYDDGSSRPLKLGEYISEKDADIQRERYLKFDVLPLVKSQDGLGLVHFDQYPPELKFQILDAVYNIGAGKLNSNYSPNWYRAISDYEFNKGYLDSAYDISEILHHGDWSINHKASNGGHSWLAVRSAMRRNPQRINGEHIKRIGHDKDIEKYYNYYIQ